MVFDNLSFGLALVAGLVSFLSPCVLSRIPVYLDYLGSRTLTPGGAATASHWGTYRHGLAFVLGFSAVFVALGMPATQDSPAAARAFAEEHGLTFPILLDSDGAVSRAYRLRSLPSTFIVDRRGVIRQIFFGGPLSEETLATAVSPLLAEAP